MDTVINNIHLKGNQNKRLHEIVHPSIKGLSYWNEDKKVVCVSEQTLTPTDITEITELLNNLPNTPVPHIPNSEERIASLEDRVTALENV